MPALVIIFYNPRFFIWDIVDLIVLSDLFLNCGIPNILVRTPLYEREVFHIDFSISYTSSINSFYHIILNMLINSAIADYINISKRKESLIEYRGEVR